MYREKLIEISNKLKDDKILYFRLYNILYVITFKNGVFEISQFGLEMVHTYSSLKKLFNEFIVYGSSLLSSIDDIKIC